MKYCPRHGEVEPGFLLIETSSGSFSIEQNDCPIDNCFEDCFDMPLSNSTKEELKIYQKYVVQSERVEKLKKLKKFPRYFFY